MSKLRNNILITGGAGYVGSLLSKQLLENDLASRDFLIIALDIYPIPDHKQLEGVIYETGDVRGETVAEMIAKYEIDTVVHLASIVTPGKKSNREFEYSVDVLGTKNVLEACVANSVNKLIVTSSGAAYGYHPDHPEWISEEVPVRGNKEFAYSYHKRLVETMLSEYREDYPELKQVVFRIGTILGATVNNQITNLFEKKFLLGVKGSASPFVFIWDKDVVKAIQLAIITEKQGVFNLAGSGKVTIDEIGVMLGKKVIKLSPKLLKYGLLLLNKLRLTQYGPEQINFLRYRPVLDNRKLRSEFGFTPTYTTEEVLHFYLRTKKHNGSEGTVTEEEQEKKHA